MLTAVLGGFDGIHLGHRHLIASAGSSPVVICMEPIPRQVIAGPSWTRRLTTPGERRKALHDMGIMGIIGLPFHSGLMECTPKEFPSVLSRLGRFDRVAVGWDFRYGHDREGQASDLAGSLPGVEVIVVPPLLREGRPVKSEVIRNLLEAGSLEEAAVLLGRRYRCLGVVARGKGRGKVLGFPTMNVTVPWCKLLPPAGSYAVSVRVRDAAFPAAAFRLPGRNCVEVHIPGFNGETYGCVAEVVFTRGIRRPERVAGDRELRELIDRDVNAAMEVMKQWQ